MLGQLVPQGGGDPIPLIKEKLLVGRRDSCDITLRFPNVSSHHCELEFRNGYWLVRDLGSSNGVKVNGVRIEEKFVLPGDELSVAKHKFKVDYEPLSDAPPPKLDEDVLSKSLMDRAAEQDQRDRERADREDPSQMPSLLEKAGLSGRPRRPQAPPVPKKPPTPIDKAEDEALKWLEDQ
jgi:pSer/pThr/pTyr-binding forkhead associated (FHA) protein